uniref:Uncharacterized protein n=1 Tax=Aegilops tauschii subsp. strangulata TaxID=200361 RepID=A0A453F4P5_AEGTS
MDHWTVASESLCSSDLCLISFPKFRTWEEDHRQQPKQEKQKLFCFLRKGGGKVSTFCFSLFLSVLIRAIQRWFVCEVLWVIDLFFRA